MMNSLETLSARCFLAKFGAKRTSAELCGGADTAHGFQLVNSAMRLIFLPMTSSTV